MKQGHAAFLMPIVFQLLEINASMSILKLGLELKYFTAFLHKVFQYKEVEKDEKF